MIYRLAEKALLLQAEAAELAPAAQMNGDVPSTDAKLLLLSKPSLELNDGTSLSIAPSDRAESDIGEDLSASRQPSSSPLPELESEDMNVIGEMQDELSPTRDEVIEVASDVDELLSSGDEASQVPVVVIKKPRGRRPKVVEEEKPVDRKTQIEEELVLNSKKDDSYELDWRRYREVSRIRPLGVDRFHQRVRLFDFLSRCDC